MEQYKAENIKVLKGLEGVRKRPAMYTGSTDDNGVNHLLFEVVDNCIDEAMAGFCKNIKITLNNDKSATITDDGRGIPVDIHPSEKIPAATLVLTTLHAGGKFDNNTYKVSGGLHGVGISVVNALSERLEMIIERDGFSYHENFAKGIAIDQLKKTGTSDQRGTSITFLPDKEIFGSYSFSPPKIVKRLRELAFLNPLVKIDFSDNLNNDKQIFHYKGGISEFVSYLNNGKKPLFENPISIHFYDTDNGIDTNIAFQYTTGYRDTIYSFANAINTIEGGIHLSSFKAVLTKLLNQYAVQNGMLKKDITFSGDDTREGLTAVISVKLPDPQFEGQTKTKLVNSEIKSTIFGNLMECLNNYLVEHPAVSKLIIEKCIAANRGRQAAKRARELVRRKSVFNIGTLPGKLSDCSSRDPSESELFIVEGDSAGGSAKQGRDKNFQAILPLKGKILNVEKSKIDKILSSEEIKNIITAIGCGVGDQFDIEKARYHKIILMTDADVDGSHIQTLLLTLFFRHMKPLIEHGYLYIAQPPLFQLKSKGTEVYLEDEREMEFYLLKRGIKDIKLKVSNNLYSSKDLEELLKIYYDYKRFFNLLRVKIGSTAITELIIYNIDNYHNLNNVDNLNNYLNRFFPDVKIITIDNVYDGVSMVYKEDGFNRIALIDDDLINSFDFLAIKKLVGDSRLKPPFTLMNKEEISFPTILNLLDRIETDAKNGIHIQRYKGLGEMNPEQLWQTTMNPEKRTIIKVEIDDDIECNRTFSVLMGEDVAPRKKFIEEYAQKAENIDV